MLLKKLNLLIKNQRIMKKIFTFCAAMLVALAASAATTPVAAGSNALKAAVSVATAGDILELGDGIFAEDGDFSINKSITIQAAENAKPVIKNTYYFKVDGGAQVTFKGIEFDGSGASDHCIRAHNNSTGAENLILENCVFHNYPSYVIYTQKDPRKWNSLIVKNCYFYNNTKYAIAILFESAGATTCKQVTVENSTFANTTGSYPAICIANGNDTQLNVDHCTFYNFGTSFIKEETGTSNVNISNCIFAQPEAKTYSPVVSAGAAIDHCLTYNNGDYPSGPTVTNSITGDPKFVHAAKGDYGLFKDSPAINAGSDSKTLGDPRWWPVKVAMKGSWDEWAKQLVFEDATDGLTATAKMHLDKNMAPGYEFKMLNGGEWCVNEGFWFTHDGNKKADNVVPQVGDGNPMVLKAYKGDYTFTWTYATKSLEVTFPSADTKYYLHGSFNEWVDIEMTENAGIMSAAATLEANVNDYRFKIKKVDFLENVTWYGAQDEINMMTKDNCTNWDLDDTGGFDIYITSDTKGDYKFSFNPADKKLNVIYPSGTGINNVEMGEKAVKVIENGQLYIIKNGVKINALGTVVK